MSGLGWMLAKQGGQPSPLSAGLPPSSRLAWGMLFGQSQKRGSNVQDLDLEPEPSRSPLAKADHKARPGTGEGVTDSAFWDSCKVSSQRTEVQERWKKSDLIMIYHNRVFTMCQAMC